jgi:DNA-binding transcriptional ArsR family regulator
VSTSLDATLAALADPHRRATVDLLRQGPRRAGELAQAAGLSAPAMSRPLRQAGLVDQVHPEFDARVRVYALRPAPMAELKAWAEAAEVLWSDQLLALRAHIEDPET